MQWNVCERCKTSGMKPGLEGGDNVVECRLEMGSFKRVVFLCPWCVAKVTLAFEEEVRPYDVVLIAEDKIRREQLEAANT